MKLAISEQLEDAAQYHFKQDRIKRLRLYKSKQLDVILDYTFNPNIKWLLPEGPISFKPCEDVKSSLVHRLHQESRKLKNFVNTGPYPNLSPEKRISLFRDVLESIYVKDADLLNSIKDKALPYKLSKEIVEEAFPYFKESWKENG